LLCGNDTCPVIFYSVNVNEVYNVSEKGETLKLLNVTVYNESFSYSLYMLSYIVGSNTILPLLRERCPLSDLYMLISTAYNSEILTG